MYIDSNSVHMEIYFFLALLQQQLDALTFDLHTDVVSSKYFHSRGTLFCHKVILFGIFAFQYIDLVYSLYWLVGVDI